MIRREEVAAAIRKEMPHLQFAIWDLTPFMPILHYWRRNMVFVECEAKAVEELAERLVSRSDFASLSFYTGIRKPVKASRIQPSSPDGSIVILGRTGLAETAEDKKLGARVPTLEKMLMDLLSFAFREELPIGLSDVADLLAYYIAKGKVKVPKMYRYATRRYVDWLLSVLLYKLASKHKVGGIDPRHAAKGKRILKAIKEVDIIE